MSCESPASCVAVGDIDNGNTDESALALTWSGKSWKNVTVHLPPGAFDDALDSVSCVPLARRCVAVGVHLPPTGGLSPVAESWNGVRCVPATPPSVTPGLLNLPDSASCVSAVRCVAVGFYITSSAGTAGLIESWNGKTWTRLRAPVPAGSKGQILTGVSCASASSCVAVGVAAGGNPGVVRDGGLVRRGRLHGIQRERQRQYRQGGRRDLERQGLEAGERVPAPATGSASLFNAVGCLSAAYCVAAGQEGPSGTTSGTSLTGFWNGKGWKLIAAP